MEVRTVRESFVTSLPERIPDAGFFIEVNGGVTSARRLGLNNVCAEVEYVAFVDADDTLPPEALADLWKGTENGKYEIVIGRCDEGRYDKDSLTREELRACSIADGVIPCALWARLVSRRLFGEETMDIPRAIFKGEDMLVNIRLAFACRTNVRLLSKKVYNYLIHSESVIHTFRNTLEYEILYDKYRKKSIPCQEQELYKTECLRIKLKGLEEVAGWQRRNVWANTEYFRELMAEVQRCEFSFPLWQRLKLTCTNDLLLKLLVYGELLVGKVRKMVLGGIIRGEKI